MYAHERLELYETGMVSWGIEMTVEESLSDDEDGGVLHCVSDSESESKNDSVFFLRHFYLKGKKFFFSDTSIFDVQ